MNNPLTQPVSPRQRMPVVDILRGWALLGVAIGNFVAFYSLGASPDREKDGLTTITEYVLQYLFSAKSWTLLSILFGYGFSVLIKNIADKTNKPVSFFLKRMAWLLVFAFFNSLFFFGDILRDYAVLGMLMLLFYRSPARVLFRASIVLMLVVPFVSAYIRNLGISYEVETDQLIPAFQSHHWLDIFEFNLKTTFFYEILNPHYAVTVHLVMLSCMLLGAAAHRSGFPRHLASSPTLIGRIFWTSLFLAVALNAGLWYLNDIEAPLLTYFRFGYWAVISTTLAIGTGIFWLYDSGRLKSLFMHLQYVGRMTLTNYMVQCLLLAVIFSGAGLGIFNTMPLWFYVLLAIGIYTAQVFFSRWWLSNFQYGPMEWLWRKQSYGAGVASIRRAQAVRLEPRVVKDTGG